VTWPERPWRGSPAFRFSECLVDVRYAERGRPNSGSYEGTLRCVMMVLLLGAAALGYVVRRGWE
jgi:hypothetical protein